MEEGDIDSGTDKVINLAIVPLINWDNYVIVNSVQYKTIGHASRVDSEEKVAGVRGTPSERRSKQISILRRHMTRAF